MSDLLIEQSVDLNSRESPSCCCVTRTGDIDGRRLRRRKTFPYRRHQLDHPASRGSTPVLKPVDEDWTWSPRRRPTRTGALMEGPPSLNTHPHPTDVSLVF